MKIPRMISMLLLAFVFTVNGFIFPAVAGELDVSNANILEVDVTALLIEQYGENVLEQEHTLILENGITVTVNPILENPDSRLIATKSVIFYDNTWTEVAKDKPVLATRVRVGNASANQTPIDAKIFITNDYPTLVLKNIAVGSELKTDYITTGGNSYTVSATVTQGWNGGSLYTITVTVTDLP